MPKTLEDGTRNAYRIARVKDKLGSRSMALSAIVALILTSSLISPPDWRPDCFVRYR
jgi:hypothetical protein